MKYRIIAILLALSVLGGCAVDTAALYGAIKGKGGEVYDKGLQGSRDFTCDIASMASIRRRYGVTAETARVYNEFCAIGNVPVLQAPEE